MELYLLIYLAVDLLSFSFPYPNVHSLISSVMVETNCKNLVPDLGFSDQASYKICLGSTLCISVCKHLHRDTHRYTRTAYNVFTFFKWVYLFLILVDEGLPNR